jgi:WhiB family redox-sensing transcriptional regulator
MSSTVNTVLEPGRRVPLAGRFDAEAASLLAGPADRSAPGGSLRSGAGLPIPNRTRSGDELPCQVHDPDLWFADTPAELEHAKALCRSCPAQLACLTGALERHEPAGVWGGQILDKGQIVTHKRPRGRPRTGSARPQRHPYDPQTAPLAPEACDAECSTACAAPPCAEGAA